MIRRCRQGVTAYRVEFALLVIWIGPGSVVSYLLMNSVPWVTFMSLYAIIVTHAGNVHSARAVEVAEASDE